MRHAKSSLDYPDLTDHDRPLSEIGQYDAPRMGQILANRGWLPQLVLVSSSRRTIETLEGMSAAIGDVSIEIRRDI